MSLWGLLTPKIPEFGGSQDQPSGHTHQLAKPLESARAILPSKSNSRDWKGKNQVKVQRWVQRISTDLLFILVTKKMT